MRRRKKTPEERQAERERGEDLTRRLQEMIERYRVGIEQSKRADAS